MGRVKASRKSFAIPRSHLYQTRDEEDIRLIQAFRNGDEQSLTALLLTYENLLFKCFRKKYQDALDEEVIDDTVQEILVKLAQSVHRFDETKGRFFMWAFTIGGNTFKNTQLSELRRSRVFIRVGMYEEKMREHRPSIDEVLSSRDSVKRIFSALNTLPPHYKDTILLYLSGKTYEEVASSLNVSSSTVRGRLYKGRKKLVSQLPPDLARMAMEYQRLGKK